MEGPGEEWKLGVLLLHADRGQKQRSVLEQQSPRGLWNTQELSPEVAGCLWTSAHHSRGLGAREILRPHALGMN